MDNEKRYYKNKNNPNSLISLELNEMFTSEDAPNWEQITKVQFDAQIAINEYKAYLRSTDYIVIKIAEASTSEAQTALRAEYADIIAERIRIRGLINELEALL